MTTITLDPRLRPIRVLSKDEVATTLERVASTFESEGHRLRRYGHNSIAQRAEQEAIHIRELLKTDFPSRLAEEFNNLEEDRMK